jgi:septum formation protein
MEVRANLKKVIHMQPEQHHLILASSSPRRQQLVGLLGLPYDIVVKPVDERIHSDMSPEKVVRELALRKARAVFAEVRERKKGSIIIGADTIVVLDGTILGKPKDEQDAFRMLSSLQGRTHQVYSGVACIDTVSGKTVVDYCVTSVTIKPLSERQIRRYVQTGEPNDKAGGYGIQGYGALIVEKIDGDYFNVVGLPLSRLSDMLCEFGIEVI